MLCVHNATKHGKERKKFGLAAINALSSPQRVELFKSFYDRDLKCAQRAELRLEASLAAQAYFERAVVEAVDKGEDRFNIAECNASGAGRRTAKDRAQLELMTLSVAACAADLAEFSLPMTMRRWKQLAKERSSEMLDQDDRECHIDYERRLHAEQLRILQEGRTIHKYDFDRT